MSKTSGIGLLTAVIVPHLPEKGYRLLVEEAGHQILFLPKYSPDLNDIEKDFSALKRAIMYSHSATYLDEIIRAYCAT
jgi:transposase